MVNDGRCMQDIARWIYYTRVTSSVQGWVRPQCCATWRYAIRLVTSARRRTIARSEPWPWRSATVDICGPIRTLPLLFGQGAESKTHSILIANGPADFCCLRIRGKSSLYLTSRHLCEKTCPKGFYANRTRAVGLELSALLEGVKTHGSMMP